VEILAYVGGARSVLGCFHFDSKMRRKARNLSLVYLKPNQGSSVATSDAAYFFSMAIAAIKNQVWRQPSIRFDGSPGEC